MCAIVIFPALLNDVFQGEVGRLPGSYGILLRGSYYSDVVLWRD